MMQCIHKRTTKYTWERRALDTPSEMCGQEHNQMQTAIKRTKTTTIDDAFISKAKIGPNFVCTCCHRMMYKQMVLPCNKSSMLKLVKNSYNKSFVQIIATFVQMVSKTCGNALSRGKMPLQAKANCLHLDPIPDQLFTLNALELRLISLRVPLMKMLALPSGRKYSRTSSECTL